MDPKFAISIVSAMHVGFRAWHPWWHPLPGGLFTSPTSIIREVQRIGYDGVQAISVWDLTGDEDGILISQGPWNAVPSFPHALRRLPGSLGVESTLEDWVVSPPLAVCNQTIARMVARDIPRIYHDFREKPVATKKYIEVHPGLGMTAEGILAECYDIGTEVVLDLRHLRRGVLKHEVILNPTLVVGESALGHDLSDWLKVIDTLADLVKVVHVQPVDQEELERFQGNPGATQLGYLLSNALSRCNVELLVAEYNPGKKALLKPSLSRKISGDFLAGMQKLCETERS